jgi:hypothetical protein
LVILGTVAGFGILELALRCGVWMPPVQLIHGFGLHALDGVPVWEEGTDRQNRACVEKHPERTRVLFFGSSITYGTDLTAAEAFTTALEARLNEERPTPGFCVLNFAQPGFAFDQKYAIARHEVARYRPALIMWESWVAWREYCLIGDTAYGIGDLRVRPDGFLGMTYVPDAINRFLFLHLRTYQYLTLTLGERAANPPGMMEFGDQKLSKVALLAQSVGAKLVLYLAPPLDRPFRETAASPPDWHRRLLDYGLAHGIPTYLLQRELIDQDYLALRLDSCCHFNAAGHRALVPIMDRIIQNQLPLAPGSARG